VIEPLAWRHRAGTWHPLHGSEHVSQVLVLKRLLRAAQNITSWPPRPTVMFSKEKPKDWSTIQSLIRSDFCCPRLIRLRQFVRVPFKANFAHPSQRLSARQPFLVNTAATRGISLDRPCDPPHRGASIVAENSHSLFAFAMLRKGSRTHGEAAMPLRKVPRRPGEHLVFEATATSAPAEGENGPNM